MNHRSFSFAQNATGFEATAKQLHTSMCAQEGVYWAALLDTAFDHEQSGAFAPSYRKDFTNCYAFPDLQGLAAVSPCLLQLPPPEAPELLSILRSLIHA